MERGCTIDDCPNPHLARGWCEVHYARWRRTGRPEGGRTIIPDIDRFWSRHEAPEGLFGCWTRKGRLSTGGYGLFLRRGAHIWAYEYFVGPVPDGLELDHLCRNRACCSPFHLEAVPHRENVLRGNAPPARQAKQTHCIHGHVFTPENTRVRANRKRDCLTCQREHNAENARRKKALRAAGLWNGSLRQ